MLERWGEWVEARGGGWITLTILKQNQLKFLSQEN